MMSMSSGGYFTEDAIQQLANFNSGGGKSIIGGNGAEKVVENMKTIGGVAAVAALAGGASETSMSSIDPLTPVTQMIIKIAIIIVVSIFFAGFIILLIGYQHIKDNTEKYRCEAWFIPVAGMFDVDPQQNMAQCNKRVFETYSGQKMNSVYWILGAMGSVMGTIGKAVQSGRMALANVNLNLLSLFNNIYNRIK